MRRIEFIAFLMLLFPWAPPHAFADENDIGRYQGRIIRKIDIVRKNVFDDRVEKGDLFIYGWANALHVVTKERVIRRELLFAAGDSLDAERILESQRNIRLTELIEDVEVAAMPVGADSVDLQIVSSDLWTMKVSPMFETGGGNHKIGFPLRREELHGQRPAHRDHGSGRHRPGRFLDPVPESTGAGHSSRDQHGLFRFHL